jgi:tRNA1Val (adenine37-N6)-methyltransferase
MTKPFIFKKFTVAQDRCAMKIGTDGVLLGAWVSIEHRPYNILDIGSGTGLIALQLAQRSSAQTIDAIEIDEEAHAQCVENFENSLWGDRLFCYHASAQEFASEVEETYDLIVSNPPFYSEDYKTKDTARDAARFNDSLPFEHLAVCAAHLLSDAGIFALILPSKEVNKFKEIARQQGLFLKRYCKVQGTPETEVKRCLMEFIKQQPLAIKEETLIIETTRHEFTSAYIALVRDFYLKM